ncbi:sensor histidine kinase [Streptomyces sp. NPDC091281]|uniref:sensor histidine kinase n=1 Tax=Streptomyces sp. NPDC091281 TaxID=3365985 RepID=UPI00380E6654
MGTPDGWWRRKSTPAKVETYTRWSFHFFALAEFSAVFLPLVGGVWTGAALFAPLAVGAHCALTVVLAARTLDWTRGRRPRPVRLLWAFTGVSAVVAVATMWVAHTADREDLQTSAATVFVICLVYGAGISTLGMYRWRLGAGVVAGYAAGAALAAAAFGSDGLTVLVAAAAVLIGGGFFAVTCAFSLWLLNAVYAIAEANETRAQLAVAEERLRFGRDLHDVMGRNLAVIALKSELAVQLARRGRPEAVEQMIEVQRIAQESQREVRDVVRGYRDADLAVELSGARGVLTAAGIECQVSGRTAGLPGEVQSALGWVVREATTNVLRHGNATRCAIDVRLRAGRVVLTVENDGVDDGTEATGGAGGSGLAGLEERLRKVDGTLVAGPAGAGTFRVVAEVPLPEPAGAHAVRADAAERRPAPSGDGV